MSERRTNQDRRNINLLVLALILVLVLIFALSFVIEPGSEPSPSPTLSFDLTALATSPKHTDGPSPTFTLSPSPMPTGSPTSTSTPSPLPSAFIGTLGPDGFSVLKWRDDSYDMCYATLNIFSVVISGHLTPYKFIFEQSGQVYLRFPATTTPTPSAFITLEPDLLLGKIIFLDKPVRVRKNKYVHVTIIFRPEDSEIPWIDDLLYIKKAPDCS